MSILKASAAALFTLFLSACGDDSGSNSESSAAEQTFMSDMVVEVLDDLPVCTASREGVTAYVKDEKTAYVCSNGEWSKDDNSIYIERIENSSSSLSSSTSTQSCSSQDKPSSSASSNSSQITESSSSEITKPAEDLSSSSEILESSSSQRPFNPDTELIDSRDGRTYKKIVIGSQTWMAENLNYADSVGYPGMQGRNWCYNDLASNCKKKGRLYTWAAAMDSAGIFSTNGKNCGYGRRCTPVYPVRGICPKGWHLPTSTEFETLFSFVGGQSVAGKVLKSTSEWNGRGEDSYGFSALPGGVRFENYFNYGASCALFLTASEYNSNAAYTLTLDLYRSDASMGHSGAKFQGGSVRCIQDGTPEQTAESSSSGGVVSSSSSAISSSSSAMSSSSIPKSSSSSSARYSSSSAVSSSSIPKSSSSSSALSSSSSAVSSSSIPKSSSSSSALSSSSSAVS
ncbi:MAG: fibrobacter succinogenes major paralogous domain-containing protein, partial [Fibrobacter sp.]|nr:fibrobacter succinogenes major paralogous domain-containing protein [Fibrobacter sp.]